MSYACGYIVYGYAFDQGEPLQICQGFEEDESITDAEWEFIDKNVQMPYCGGGDGMAYIGKDVKFIDECGKVDLTELTNFVVTPELDAEVDEIVAQLPEKIKPFLTERKLWLAWGSS